MQRMFLPRSLFLAMYHNENQQINGRVKKLRIFFVTSIKISTLKQLLLIYSVIYFLSLFVRFLIDLVLERSKRENSMFHFDIFSLACLSKARILKCKSFFFSVGPSL